MTGGTAGLGEEERQPPLLLVGQRPVPSPGVAVEGRVPGHELSLVGGDRPSIRVHRDDLGPAQNRRLGGKPFSKEPDVLIDAAQPGDHAVAGRLGGVGVTGHLDAGGDRDPRLLLQPLHPSVPELEAEVARQAGLVGVESGVEHGRRVAGLELDRPAGHGGRRDDPVRAQPDAADPRAELTAVGEAEAGVMAGGAGHVLLAAQDGVGEEEPAESDAGR